MTTAELAAQARALRWIARQSIDKANAITPGRKFVLLETFMNELATQKTIDGYISALATENATLRKQLAAAQAQTLTAEQQQALANYAALEAKINAANNAAASPPAAPAPDPTVSPHA